LHPTLSALVALQALDTAADSARKRLADLPAAELAIDQAVAAAEAELATLKTQLKDNHDARRALEKDVALVDSRLSRFEDHKAAVKTNQEYTALLHEIATAKTEKDALEERILVLMESADELSGSLKAAESALASRRREGADAKARLAVERTALERELAGLAHDRTQEARALLPAVLTKYDQLLKMRRGVAVAVMNGELCTACHVRLRPHVAQLIRRNEEVVQCESCQRILYAPPPAG
jgi:predicted  nucleic acid-binding Zn-ribbon protein